MTWSGKTPGQWSVAEKREDDGVYKDEDYIDYVACIAFDDRSHYEDNDEDDFDYQDDEGDVDLDWWRLRWWAWAWEYW